jgi:hypothetical protein
MWSTPRRNWGRIPRRVPDFRSAIHRNPEHLAFAVRREVVGGFFIDGVVEHGDLVFRTGVQTCALEPKRLQQVLNVEVVQIRDAENPQSRICR